MKIENINVKSLEEKTKITETSITVKHKVILETKDKSTKITIERDQKFEDIKQGDKDISFEIKIPQKRLETPK